MGPLLDPPCLQHLRQLLTDPPLEFHFCVQSWDLILAKVHLVFVDGLRSASVQACTQLHAVLSAQLALQVTLPQPMIVTGAQGVQHLQYL